VWEPHIKEGVCGVRSNLHRRQATAPGGDGEAGVKTLHPRWLFPPWEVLSYGLTTKGVCSVYNAKKTQGCQVNVGVGSWASAGATGGTGAAASRPGPRSCPGGAGTSSPGRWRGKGASPSPPPRGARTRGRSPRGAAGRGARGWRGASSSSHSPVPSSKFTPGPGATSPYSSLGPALGPGALSSAGGSDGVSAAPSARAAMHAHQAPFLLLILLFLFARGDSGLRRPPGPSHGAGR